MYYAIVIVAILALAALAAWGFLALFGISFWIMFLAFTACGALGFVATAFWD